MRRSGTARGPSRCERRSFDVLCGKPACSQSRLTHRTGCQTPAVCLAAPRALLCSDLPYPCMPLLLCQPTTLPLPCPTLCPASRQVRTVSSHQAKLRMTGPAGRTKGVAEALRHVERMAVHLESSLASA